MPKFKLYFNMPGIKTIEAESEEEACEKFQEMTFDERVKCIDNEPEVTDVEKDV